MTIIHETDATPVPFPTDNGKVARTPPSILRGMSCRMAEAPTGENAKVRECAYCECPIEQTGPRATRGWPLIVAQRLHDLAGDIRAITREPIPPEIQSELITIERGLERAASRAETYPD